MTAQSSAKSGLFYKFLPAYVTKLRYLKPQIIMNCIFSLLSYPLLATFCYFLTAASLKLGQSRINRVTPDYALENAVEIWQGLTIAGIIICVLCLIGLFVFTFVTTVKSFRYLHDKTAVDMDYSLPISHNTRFFADLASVFTACIAPHLIAGLIGLAYIPIIRGMMIADIELLNVDPAEVNAVFDVLTKLAAQCIFTGIFACIMQIGFTLLMISVCGKKAESSLYPVLLNIAIPIIHALSLWIIDSGTYGSYGEPDFMPVAASSPVGMVIMTIYSAVSSAFGGVFSSTPDPTVSMPAFMPAFGIPALILTIAFFAGAYFLIKFRRTELVGVPYVYRGMALVIPGTIILTVSLPICQVIFDTLKRQGNNGYDGYSYTPNIVPWIVGLLISTFIIYVIMELISGRAFRKFHITLLKWAGTVAVCVGLTAALTYSNGFGAANIIPSAGSVQSVNVSFYYRDRYGTLGENDKSYSYHFRNVTDPKVVEGIVNAHRLAPKSGSADNSRRTELIIRYTMKDGSRLSRQYEAFTQEQWEQTITALVTPELWFNNCFEHKNEILADEEFVSYSLHGTRGSYDMNESFKLSGLVEAIKQDCQKISYGLITGNSQDDYEIYSLYCYNAEHEGKRFNIHLYSWMENTAAYLENGGAFGVSSYKRAFLVENTDGMVVGEAEYYLAKREGLTVQEFSETYGLDPDIYLNLRCTELYAFDEAAAFIDKCRNSNVSNQNSRYYLVLTAAGSYKEAALSDNSTQIYFVDEQDYDTAQMFFDWYGIMGGYTDTESGV